jgi:GAF domain-containing protein
VRAADRRSSLSDYPAADRLAALETITIQDTRDDNPLPDAEREWLRTRGIRAMLVLPLVVKARITGLISLAHDEPVSVSPARLRALHTAAAQLAVVSDNRRLLDIAQATALQEQMINALVARFQSAASTEALLRMAVTELGQSLGARTGAIRLAMPTDVEGAAT